MPELKKVHWYRLHCELGSPEAILGTNAATICKVANVSEETARAILRGPDRDCLEQEKENVEATAAGVYTFDDERYPENLRRCSAPPMLLFVLGDIRADDAYAVVVVGSRSATEYGRMVCQKLVAELTGAGVTVISGMAHGLDSVAHETALRHGGRTLAVLAYGLRARESSQRLALRERIAGQGAVVTEFPTTAVAARYHFPIRNHTMAALGLGAVVVEAAEKSGALITAEKALEENRQVFAVPGDVTRSTSRGTNALLRAGASLARDGRDVLADLAPQLGAILREKTGGEPADVPPAADASLSEAARAVLARVQQEPTHFDLLHESLEPAGMDFSALSAALLELEMKGLVRHLPGNLYTAG